MKFIKTYQLFESQEWVENIISACKKYKIQNYQINGNKSIDVIGHVNLSCVELTECPILFNRISGDFDISNNNINTFKNFPKFVDGNIYAMRNKINTFSDCDIEYIGKKFNLSYNPINTLNNCPSADDGIYINFSNLTYISEEELDLFEIYRGISILGIVNTPIQILLETINFLIDDITILSPTNDILMRIHEFDIIVNMNEVDVIYLNRLFDFYEKEFDYDLFIELYNKYLSPTLNTSYVSKVQIPYTFINI